MICIGNKCPNYREHLFSKERFFTCIIRNRTMMIRVENTCLIDSELENLEEQLKRYRKIKCMIKENQKERTHDV